ncbi:MAG: tyrosine-type recombinase/integrase [Sphingomonadaceae bacterium]
MTFAEAVLKYAAKPKDAKYLIPIVEKIGSIQIKNLKPRMVRGLGPEIYPDASTDTWTRQIITPVRAVVNNLYDDSDGKAYRIRGYNNAEKTAQDEKRGSQGRPKYQPADWEWLLRFREKAPPKIGTLAFMMFATGGRISQTLEMHPQRDVNVGEGTISMPGAKGHSSRSLKIPPELMEELCALPLQHPRGWKRTPENLRLFGYAGRSGPRKLWAKACSDAGIRFIPFHAAGRHGFGQEMNVRQGIDANAAAFFGGWADINLMRKAYTHAEDAEEKVNRALRRGQRKAERKTKLKLKKED